VMFLISGVDFERRYATSGLAAVVLLAFWLFMTNALILVGFQIAQEVRASRAPADAAPPAVVSNTYEER
jgi:uncharacterized BrkB/YihY/UPF0761 family membrane protein